MKAALSAGAMVAIMCLPILSGCQKQGATSNDQTDRITELETRLAIAEANVVTLMDGCLLPQF